MEYDLIVVGGGPAGILGAATAAGRGLNVVLLEKNDSLGRKLLITGNGRCNVTNCCSFEDFKNHIVTNEKFLYSSLSAFSSRDLMELLRSLGVPTKVENSNRVFPASDRSTDVLGALQKHLQRNRVAVRLNSEVQGLLTADNRVNGVILRDRSKVAGKKVLVATGGMSYRQTGSSGDGYAMARSVGHTIISPRPALVSLEIRENWVRELKGLALDRVIVRGLAENRMVAEQEGELLFTHFGVSGPAILNLSSYLNRYFNSPVTLQIDVKPALSSERLDLRLQKDFKTCGGRLLKNALPGLLPQRLLPAIFHLSGVDGQKQSDQVTREERERLVRTVKGLAMTVKGARPLNEATVTAGGIHAREINSSTLESKRISGLFFAGEVLDVDALTGGYNLQIAFSTGYLGGLGAARKTSGG